MTMQSYRSSTMCEAAFLTQLTSSYRFFADFLDRDPFADFDDLEVPFDPLVLLARALFAAVEADFVFDADFFAAPDFLDDFEAVRPCLRSFSAAISSPSASILSSP